MPYYTTTQKPTRGGGVEPVLPPGIVNWSGIVMEDGRYLIWARATVDISDKPLISIVTPRQAQDQTSKASEIDMSLWKAAE